MNRSFLRRSLTQLLVGLSLGYVVLVGGGVTSAAMFRWQLITFGLSFVLCGGWLIWRGMVRRARWPLTGLEWPLGGAALAGILSLLASPDWRPGLARLSELAAFAALFYMAVDLLAAGLPRSVIARALIGVSGTALSFGVMEIYLHYQSRWPSLFTQPLYRLVSLLGHPNLLAGLATLTLPLVLWEWRSDRRVWVRSSLLVWVIGYGIVLPFSSSRGGLLGLGVIFGVVSGWFAWRQGWTATRRLVEGLRGRNGLVVGAGGLGVAALIGLFIYQSLHPSHGGAAFSGRLYIWEIAANVIAAHFWLGAGPGRFGFESARAVSVPPRFWPLHAHSVPWQVFAEFGAIGFVALIGLIIGAARAIWRLLRDAQGEEQTWIVWVSAGLAGYAAQNLVDDQTHVLAVMVPLMLVLALAVGAHPMEQVNNLSYSVRRGRVPLASIGLPLFVLGVLQAQWLWAYAAFDQARLANAVGDGAQALVLTQEAARRDAILPFYDVEAGLLAARLDDWPAAQAHFERAARCEGSLAFVWANLGVARWRNGDQSGGLAALQSAAQIAPASPTILLAAGGMAEAAGQPEAADVYYRATLALQPDWADRPFWDQTEARMNARAAVPLPAPDPNDPYLKARAALTVGRVAEARSWMDVGLGDPNHAPTQRVEWQMLFGDVLLAEGDEAGAMNQYTGALAAFANPSIEGTGYAFWNTYGFWLFHREPFPFDSVPGLLPLDVTPEMLARFEQLSRWLRERGSCAEALAVDRQRLRLDSSSITSSSCP